jgi:transcriptional regulator with XRE-family HTH domain
MGMYGHPIRDAFLCLKSAPHDAKSTREVYAVAHRLALAITWKAGRSDLADDVTQEVMIALPIIVQRWDTEWPVEPLLLGWIRRIVMALNRRNPVGMDTEDASDKEDIEALEAYEKDCLEDDFDRKLALRATVAIMLQEGNHNMHTDRQVRAYSPLIDTVTVKKVTRSAEEENLVNPRRKRGTSAQTLSPDHAEIRNIRLEMGVTQTEFAEALGIPVPTLVSYEHGRTQKVRKEYLERARAFRENNKERLEWRKKFDDRSMKEILDDWASQLGARPDDLQTMAALIGTVVSTIFRWRNGQVRPSITELVAYDQAVQITATRLAKSQKAIAEKIVIQSKLAEAPA